ncbi:MAG: NYN domain-containing protein [Oscillospiraceae bacterium]|nr:NYN domain-containing protein [Oscillospiraceae bacterium]
MPEQEKKTPCCVALLAHVDAGKTTLSEALLYVSGTRRTLGRVDHGNAYLDTHSIERQRGITIFSKQAMLETKNRVLTLVDTPGHVDFSAETERTLPILDCAILVISGTDGVQAHTATLWKLLQQYHVPTFLFINKMDLPDTDKQKLLSSLQSRLDPGCIDFGAPTAEIHEAAAMCDEALLENYLASGIVTDGNLRSLIAQRRIFPCCFGSALKLTAIEEFLQILDQYAPQPPSGADFAAKVYKISRDPQGNRLTWLRITGGTLKVRSAIGEEKIQAIRLYSGEKFTTVEEATAGMLCAVTGLSETYAGQGLGQETSSPKPTLQPVMTYRIHAPMDPSLLLPKLRMLEEEDPLLRLLWDNSTKQISVQIMGRVQLEVFKSLVQQRFNVEISLLDPKIYYLETIENKVEGVGHFEPLRHYAEAHILLESLPRGSGLQFDTTCSTDVLDINWQRLILGHMSEKTHRGVLTGAPITDMKLTLLVGKAHLKHTEGGDFRQATYRAIPQGLMQAKSVLLEPWYAFQITAPTPSIGRAITDIRAMGGELDAPENLGENSVLTGLVPASELGDYSQTLASYTQGRGQLQISLHGYLPCHNTDAVVEKAAYDPEADLENTPDSVFCAHGAGFTVKWHEVKNYMHLESGLKEEKAPQILTRNLYAEDLELEKIMEREFGPIKRPQYHAPANRPASELITIRPPKQQYLIVDGYNMIFAWPELADTAANDLEAARRHLCDKLSSYASYKKCRLVVVFDGYKVKGNPGEKEKYVSIQVVFTKENQTGDAYIESLVSQIGPNYNVRVATSDALVQLSSIRSGVLRVSARELKEEVDAASKEMQQHYQT